MYVETSIRASLFCVVDIIFRNTVGSRHATSYCTYECHTVGDVRDTEYHRCRSYSAIGNTGVHC